LISLWALALGKAWLTRQPLVARLISFLVLSGSFGSAQKSHSIVR
jgi:hypothetical protein